jgi:hypothetical protein
MEEQIKINSLPEKSALWIGGNIAGGVMIVIFLIRFIGGIILGPFFSKNIILSIIFGIILLLIGSYFGSIFGVRYVTKRAKISIEKIKSISIVAAVIPFLFLLLWVVLDLYLSLSKVEKFILSHELESLIATIIVAIVVFFVVRNSLQKFCISQIKI